MIWLQLFSSYVIIVITVEYFMRCCSCFDCHLKSVSTLLSFFLPSNWLHLEEAGHKFSVPWCSYTMSLFIWHWSRNANQTSINKDCWDFFWSEFIPNFFCNGFPVMEWCGLNRQCGLSCLDRQFVLDDYGSSQYWRGLKNVWYFVEFFNR